MTRDEWIGLGVSVGAHLALLLFFALLTAGRPATPALGALQLEIGAFAQGRPVQQAEAPAEDAQPAASQPQATEAAPDASPSSEQSAAPSEPAPEASTPVDLPEQEAAAGEEPPPEEPPSAPEQDAPPAPQSSEETEPTGAASDEEETEQTSSSTPSEASEDAAETEGGETTGAATGASSGEEGTGDDENKASPFDIEGLDRTRLYGALPEYTANVERTIKIEITVSPDGRVIGQVPVLKGNPSLERSVMAALREWRFNRLPSGAPQKNQTGVVTFRFRLE